MVIYKQLDIGLSVLKQIYLNLKSLNKTLNGQQEQSFFFMNLMDRVPLDLITADLFEALEAVDYTIYHVRHDVTKNNKYQVLCTDEELQKVHYGKMQAVIKIL